MLQLSVGNRPKAANKHNLIKGDFLGLFVLNVANSAIGENMPLDLEFPEDLLDSSQDLSDDAENSCELQVVNVLGHDCGQATFVMSHAELIVDLTRNELALVGDFAQLHGKGARSITESNSKFVTMQHFVLRVKVLKSRDHSEWGSVISWQI